jgi:hypothetical protein
LRKAEIILDYQPLIHEPPVSPGALYQNAASNDDATIKHWEHTWLGNMTANKQYFGDFAKLAIGQEFNKYLHGAAIVAGSGPSLKVNAKELANRGKIPLVSCLHNFHYFEDLDLKPEYYVSLDANNKLVEEEVTEGGTKPEKEYWEKTKDRTLIAFVASPPELLKKWKGKILFYNSPLPDPELVKKMDAIETFNQFMSTGGNVLGACLYFAKSVLGAFQTIFVGADFSFGYDKRFHSWDSKYDKAMGFTQRATDVYGIKVHTWPSYYGFKQYFDSVAMRVPGIYYNCTEGGCLGAYDQGNLSIFRYLDLNVCLKNLNMSLDMSDSMTNALAEPKKILYS